MGYKWRKTLGRINCRPKEFQSDIFPMPKLICSSKCPYDIFCMAELNKTSIGDRIKQLRLSLQKPYHVFSAMENGEIYLLFENDEGERISFREKTLVGAVKKAEDYLVASQIRSGQDEKLKKQEREKSSPIASEVPLNQKEESDGITVESHIRDDRGQRHPDI